MSELEVSRQLTLPLSMTSAPEEDSGSEVAGWYDFQYACAARHCLDMVRTEAGLEWVLCEWHTDYALGWADGRVGIASVKYREPSSGTWTIARLFSDGGFKTLFRRWSTARTVVEVRWVTNGGLDIDCRALARACAVGDGAALEDQSRLLARRFGAKDFADVLAFLRVLRFDTDAPHLQYMRAVEVDRRVRMLLRHLGLGETDAGSVYDAVVTLVANAARSCGANAPEVWTCSRVGALEQSRLTDAAIASRLVTRQDVLAAITAIARRAEQEEEPHTIAAASRLSVKLAEGQVVPNRVRAARRARRDWAIYEASATAPLPGGASNLELRRLRTKVSMLAADAQYEASQAGMPYGEAMYSLLAPRLGALAKEFGIDETLLVGLIFDLTAQCEVWWSPEFDVDARLSS